MTSSGIVLIALASFVVAYVIQHYTTLGRSMIAIGGGAVWTLGPGATNHIGASGLIFGYLGFLLARGIVERPGFWIVVSVLVVPLYGGMIAGVLPGQEGVSWQGHLFGFLGGIVAAKVLFTRERT